LQEIGVPKGPATGENVLVGKAKEVVGHVIGNDDLEDEGEEQEEIATSCAPSIGGNTPS
jgi:hypothetical protein